MAFVKSLVTGGAPRGVVHGGREHARRAAEPAIRKDVRAQYEGAAKRAGLFGRIVLRIQIEREVRRRLREVAPDDAHYGVGP